MRSGVSWLTCGALGAHVALLLATTACTRTGRPVKMVWANEPGDGAVATCPEDAVDATGGLSGFGDRTPSPTQARCSYADAVGPITQLRGRVLGQGHAGTLPEPMGDTPVRIHRLTDEGGRLGPVVAETVTDPQGGWSLSASLPEGEYLLVVPGDEPGRAVGQRPLELQGQRARRVDDLDILVPLPDASAPDAAD